MNARELRDAVIDALDENRAPDHITLAVAGFLDHLLFWKRVESLSVAEGRLVAAIYAARGRLVNNATLVEAMESEGEGNLVSVRLSKLKTKRPDLWRHIQTVQGHGRRRVGPRLDELEPGA